MSEAGEWKTETYLFFPEVLFFWLDKYFSSLRGRENIDFGAVHILCLFAMINFIKLNYFFHSSDT